MTTDVTDQGAFLAMFLEGAAIQSQSAYLVILSDKQINVSSQAFYLGLFPALTNKKRRIIMTMTG